MKKLDFLLITILSLIFTVSITFGRIEIISFLIIFSIVHVVFNLIFKKINTLKSQEGKIKKKEFLVYAIIILIPLIIALIAYYPGMTFYDTLTQWNQAEFNQYNNWHPIFHTLIFIKFPTLIHNTMFSCTAFQVLLIFSILLYFAYFLRKNYLSFKNTILVLLLMVLNPLFFKYSVTILKDTPYSWFMFLTTLFLINIYKSDGEWLKNNINKILFIGGSLGIFLTRHNGIVPFFFVFVALMIFYPKLRKFLGISLVSIFVLYFGIFGSIFNLNTTGGKSEMLGVVLGQVSYYYNNDVEFNDEELELLNKLAPLSAWKEKYNPRNFNYIKWQSDNFTKEANQNFFKIIGMWINKSIQNPKEALVSYLYMTSPIWEVKTTLSDIEYKGDSSESISMFKKGDKKDISDKVYQKLINYNNLVTYSPLRIFLVNFGDGFFLIAVSLYLIIKKSKLNLKRYVPFIPVVLNTLVIMLLITGEEYRFVYANILCCYPLLIYGLYENNDFKSKVKEIFKKLFITKTNNSLIQFLRYFFVGGVAAIVNIGMLYIFTEVFHIYYVISNILAFTLGLIVNYLLSKKLVFQDNVVDKRKEFIIYALIGVLGLGLDTLLVLILSDKLKIYYMLSKIISTIIVFVWNFMARKIFYKIIK